MRPATSLMILALVLPLPAAAADRPVDPTFLYRHLSDAPFRKADVTTETCRYRPLFGEGDSETSIVKGVARYGEIVVEPGGRCEETNYSAEEQIYFVLSGSGKVGYQGGEVPIRKEDFMYFAPGSAHAAVNTGDEPLRIIVMGFRMPAGAKADIPEKLPIANTSQAKKQVVGNHPPSTLYQLLMGDVNSKRDVLATAHQMTSLFIMEFVPGGTNHPHHHPREEEIYLVLDGKGEIVAGGGLKGVEGRHPAEPGDAYFYRLNATVGFYADPEPGAEKARILAVRSWYPGMKNR